MNLLKRLCLQQCDGKGYVRCLSQRNFSLGSLPQDLQQSVKLYSNNRWRRLVLARKAEKNSLVLKTAVRELSLFSFDTYRLVRQLEAQGFTRGQSVAVMRTINALMVDTMLGLKDRILSTTDLENETYAYKSALADLRQELSLLRQNDTAQLRTEAEQILREIENMNSVWVDHTNTLKGEISMDMNNRKSETREHETLTELRIQDVQHKLVLKLSELKTAMERVKMESTTKVVWISLSTLGILMLVDYMYPMTPNAQTPKPAWPGNGLEPTSNPIHIPDSVALQPLIRLGEAPKSPDSGPRS